MKNILFFTIIFVILFGIASTTNAGEKIKDMIISTLTADALKIKKQIEVGGKIYLNGTISNKTKGRGGTDNPVIFSDDVRIDGRVYRSSPAGDSNPFIINDDVEIKGNLTVAGDASYIPAMTCANGEVLKYGSSGWICGRDNDLFTANCFNADEILKWNGSKWVCAKETLASLNCSSLQVPKWTETRGWICADDKTPGTPPKCSGANQKIGWDGSGWVCEQEVDFWVRYFLDCVSAMFKPGNLGDDSIYIKRVAWDACLEFIPD